MLKQEIRKVSILKGLKFSTRDDFKAAFPHLTEEEVDKYYTADHRPESTTEHKTSSTTDAAPEAYSEAPQVAKKNK